MYNLYVVMRGSEGDGPVASLSDKMVAEFYRRVVRMRGTTRRVVTGSGAYIGVRLMGNGERWDVHREVATYSGAGDTAGFIDHDRELERWLLSVGQRGIRESAYENIIIPDLEQVLHYAGFIY